MDEHNRDVGGFNDEWMAVIFKCQYKRKKIALKKMTVTVNDYLLVAIVRHVAIG